MMMMMMLTMMMTTMMIPGIYTMTWYSVPPSPNIHQPENIPCTCMYRTQGKLFPLPPPSQKRKVLRTTTLSLMTAYLLHQANGVNFLSSSLLSLLRFFTFSLGQNL